MDRKFNSIDKAERKECLARLVRVLDLATAGGFKIDMSAGNFTVSMDESVYEFSYHNIDSNMRLLDGLEQYISDTR